MQKEIGVSVFTSSTKDRLKAECAIRRPASRTAGSSRLIAMFRTTEGQPYQPNLGIPQHPSASSNSLRRRRSAFDYRAIFLPCNIFRYQPQRRWPATLLVAIQVQQLPESPIRSIQIKGIPTTRISSFKFELMLNKPRDPLTVFVFDNCAALGYPLANDFRFARHSWLSNSDQGRKG